MALDPIEAWRIGSPPPGEEYAEGHQPPYPTPLPPGMGPVAKPPHRVLQPFNINGLAAGASMTLRMEYEPDYWYVAIGAAAGSAVNLYLSEAPGGGFPFAILAVKGYAQIPGRGLYLTVLNTGTATLANCTVLAANGFSGMVVSPGG